MGRFTKTTLAVVLIACGNAMAERATDEQMAQEALGFRSSNPERLAEVREEARQAMALLATGPAQAREAYASIVFSTGLTAIQVEQFAEAFALEVFTAQAKFPMGDEGQVMTMSTGLSFFDGKLSESLRLGMGSMQFRMMETAQQMEDEERQLFLDVAQAREPLYYRIDVIGRPANLQQAIDSPSVAVVSPDPTGTRLQGARDAHARVREMRRFQPPPVLRRLEDGPPPGVTPDRVIPFLPH